MGKVFNPKWNAGWLEWGHSLNLITAEAEKDLEKLKEDHPDWNFEELAEDLRNGKISAWLTMEEALESCRVDPLYKPVMTLDDFNKYPSGVIMNSGVLANSPEGIFMTRDGGDLLWVAIKGHAKDWTIYCHWSDKSIDWVRQHGDKVMTEEHIRRCINCEDEVFKLYRF